MTDVAVPAVPTLAERLRLMPDLNLLARLANTRELFHYTTSSERRAEYMDQIDAMVIEVKSRGIG